MRVIVEIIKLPAAKSCNNISVKTPWSMPPVLTPISESARHKKPIIFAQIVREAKIDFESNMREFLLFGVKVEVEVKVEVNYI
jgi:hypothetical protein